MSKSYNVTRIQSSKDQSILGPTNSSKSILMLGIYAGQKCNCMPKNPPKIVFNDITDLLRPKELDFLKTGFRAKY